MTNPEVIHPIQWFVSIVMILGALYVRWSYKKDMSKSQEDFKRWHIIIKHHELEWRYKKAKEARRGKS